MIRFDLRAALPRHVVQLSRNAAADSAETLCAIRADGADAGRVGYGDRNGTRTIRSLVLEPKYRRRGIGAHVLRWLACEAAAAGSRRIEAKIPTNDEAARNAFRSAGFLLDAASRGHIRASRRLAPLAAVQPPSPAYASLRGTDVVTQHMALGEAAAAALRRVPGVQLVLGLGSIGRRFGDGDSDIDLFVIGRGSGLARIPAGEQWIAGFDFDVFVFDLDEAPYAEWDDERRQAVGEGAVLWSATPSAIDELRRATRLRRDEQRARIAETLLSLSWTGFHPPSLHGKRELGYYWVLPPDLWIRRGHLASAHAAVDEAVGFLIALLFFANRQFLAPRKWRRYLVEWLPWTPKQLAARLDAIETCSRDHGGFAARAGGLLDLIEETFAHLRESGLVPRNVYRSFQRTTPDYSSHDALRPRKGHADR